MPSSISNSEHPITRVPAKNWPKVWLVSVLSAAVLLSAAEVFWRSRGYRPSVTESGPRLWAACRTEVYHENAIVLTGSSRMVSGFATDVCREMFPNHHVVQLAIAGAKPIATLRDLAKDDQFRSVVICEIDWAGFSRDSWETQEEYVKYFHEEFRLTNLIDVRIATYLQARCCVLHWQLGLKNLLAHIAKHGTFPEPLWQVTRQDRSRVDDYSLADVEALRRERASANSEWGTPLASADAAEWREDVAEVDRFVKQIQRRGGRVVFVRFPTSGPKWEWEERIHPKNEFWDRMAASVSAETIHFKDVPTLDCFECPDTSHLDFRDARTFTRALLDELMRRGVLQRP